MSEQDDILLNERKTNNTRLFVIVGGAVVTLAIFLRFGLGVGTEPVRDPNAPGVSDPSGSVVKPETAESKAQRAFEQGTSAQIESLETMVNNLASTIERSERDRKSEAKRFQREAEAREKQVAKEMAAMRKARNIDDYRESTESIRADGAQLPNDPWALDPSEFGGTELGEQPTSAPRYVRLGSSVSRNAKPDSGNDADGGGFSLPGTENWRFERDAKDDKPQSPTEDEPPTTQAPDVEKLQIAAGSFAKVTPMYTTNCPIGASTVSSGEDAVRLPPAPIILTVQAEFNEPNGQSTYVGTVHLMGFCAATYIDRDFGEAAVSITHMSSKSAELGAQFVEAPGNILMDITNEQNVRAKIRKKPRSTMLSLAFAEGLEAGTNVFTQSQFTQGLDNGSPTQAFTGSYEKAIAGAMGSGVAGGFRKAMQRIDAAQFDTVPIKAGIPLYYMTHGIIELDAPASKIDNTMADPDRLL